MAINVVGQRLKCIASEKEAFTFEDGKVVRWSANGRGKSQVFQAKNGTKMVLRSDQGRWWESNKKSADYCEWAEIWYGEFPYGSWAIGFRVSGSGVEATEFETEINPRGMTAADRWRESCRTYGEGRSLCEAIADEESSYNEAYKAFADR